PVQRKNGSVRRPLIESGACLFADSAFTEQSGHRGGNLEGLMVSILRKPLRQIPAHVGRDVETADVAQAKCGALGMADQGTGQIIDLFDRQAVFQRSMQSALHPIDAEAIGDESWRVLGRYYPLAKDRFGESFESIERIRRCA